MILMQVVWFLLPAGFANMAPVLVKKINFLNYPIDNGKNFSGSRLFGVNKTWRGLFFGVICSFFVIIVQKYFYLWFVVVREISYFDYTNRNIYLIGLLFGMGALLGDLIKSFFKRRLNIAPSKPWIPFDQLDWIIGSLFFVSLYVNLTWLIWFYSLLFYGFLHPVVNLIGYFLHIKDNKF